jgi:hypothetical protein
VRRAAVLYVNRGFLAVLPTGQSPPSATSPPPFCLRLRDKADHPPLFFCLTSPCFSPSQTVFHQLVLLIKTHWLRMALLRRW